METCEATSEREEIVVQKRGFGSKGTENHSRCSQLFGEDDDSKKRHATDGVLAGDGSHTDESAK